VAGSGSSKSDKISGSYPQCRRKVGRHRLRCLADAQADFTRTKNEEVEEKAMEKAAP
jgi:hypothetical protein